MTARYQSLVRVVPVQIHCRLAARGVNPSPTIDRTNNKRRAQDIITNTSTPIRHHQYVITNTSSPIRHHQYVITNTSADLNTLYPSLQTTDIHNSPDWTRLTFNAKKTCGCHIVKELRLEPLVSSVIKLHSDLPSLTKCP